MCFPDSVVVNRACRITSFTDKDIYPCLLGVWVKTSVQDYVEKFVKGIAHFWQDSFYNFICDAVFAQSFLIFSVLQACNISGLVTG